MKNISRCRTPTVGWLEIFIKVQLYSGIFCDDQKCSLMISRFQTFSVVLTDFSHFQLGPLIFNSDKNCLALKIDEFILCNNIDHGCFCSKILISIEIHGTWINCQFWNILKNLFESLNQSEFSRIIAQSNKNINPGKVLSAKLRINKVFTCHEHSAFEQLDSKSAEYSE